MNIGELHVVMVHFPIALAVCAILADLLWLATRKEGFKNAGMYCLVLAGISAVPVVITGLIKVWGRQFGGDYLFIVTVHKYLGITSFVIAVLASVIRLSCRGRMKKWWLVGYCILMLALVVSIALTGHYGGMLVHGQDFLSDIF